LRQIGLALHNYESVKRRFPPAYLTDDPYADGVAYGIKFGDDNRNGPPGWGWGALILPYIEQGNLHARLRLDLPCWAPENALSVKTVVPLFLCPSATGGSDGFAVQYAAP